MNLCPRCYANGRSLWPTSCLCVDGGALKPSEFHAWNATRRIPYNLPKQERPVFKPIVKQTKLVFGQNMKRPQRAKS
jgi:hypothetical protein